MLACNSVKVVDIGTYSIIKELSLVKEFEKSSFSMIKDGLLINQSQEGSLQFLALDSLAWKE